MTATPAGVREAVASVLGDPGYRRAAQALQRELDALPEPSVGVSLIERLVLGARES